MPSLGELFIELGVVGDVKPLEKAIRTMKEAVKQIDDEINANKRLLKYLQDIKNARNKNEKKLIKENFASEIKKQKMLDEVNTNQKAIDGKKELAKNIAGVVKGVGVFVGAIAGAAAVLNKFTNDLVQTNQAMLDLTRNTDIAQGTFQKWGNIGKMLGVENAEQQLESLNQRLFEMSLTGQGAEGFMLGGINPVGQDAEGVLEQLRQRVSGMNDTTATYLLQKMGLDPRMLHLLRMSRQEFESLGETIRKYQLSPEDTRGIQAMNIQLQIAGIKLRYLKDKAILALMPAWTAFMESLARVAEGLETAVKWVTDLISKSPQLQSALLGIAAALGVVLAVAQPLWAALSALYLLFDDMAVFFSGGDSVIGMLLNYTETFGEDIKNIFKGFFEGDPLSELIKGLHDLGNTKIPIPPIFQSIIAAGAAMASIVENLHKFKNTANKGLDGTPTGEAAPIGDAGGAVTGGAASLGYVGALPNLENMFITPAAAQNIANSSTVNHYDQRQINQTNQIQTNQPAFDIGQQLAQARYAAVYGWV